jgi:LysR family transcriptional regulator, regulator for metE and metH
MLDVKYLKLIKALSQTQSISLAAKQLHLTQSALSHQIAKLEQYYNTPIIQRNSRPLNLTQIGKQLLEYALDILPKLEAAQRILKQNEEVRILRIAVECHSCFDWLMPAMHAYKQQYPHIELDLVSGFQPQPEELLLDASADIVLTSNPQYHANLVYTPLFEYEILAILPLEHKLQKAKYIEAKHFAHETLITYPVSDASLDILKQVLIPHGVNPKRRVTELTIVMIMLVAANQGLATLPKWAIQNYIHKQYVKTKRIGEHGLWGKLYACTQTPMQNYQTAFIEHLHATATSNLIGIRDF